MTHFIDFSRKFHNLFIVTRQSLQISNHSFMNLKSLFPREAARLFALVILSGVWCVLLWFLRAWRTDSSQYFFFVYNLALAFIPLALSLVAVRIQNRKLFVPVMILWLLFFPNAPYLLTDLIHLRPKTDAPFWFDWIFMISYAGTGFLTGCYSLLLIHRRLIQWFGTLKAWVAVIGILCLSSFGIYLGRFPRWNSWDIATRPGDFFMDVFTRFTAPLEHPILFTYTPSLAFLLIIGYLAVAGGWLRDSVPVKCEAR